MIDFYCIASLSKDQALFHEDTEDKDACSRQIVIF